MPRAKPRRVAFFYALLRGFTYSAARSRRNAAGGEAGLSMLSELAPAMTMPLSLIPA